MPVRDHGTPVVHDTVMNVVPFTAVQVESGHVVARPDDLDAGDLARNPAEINRVATDTDHRAPAVALALPDRAVQKCESHPSLDLHSVIVLLVGPLVPLFRADGLLVVVHQGVAIQVQSNTVGFHQDSAQRKSEVPGDEVAGVGPVEDERSAPEILGDSHGRLVTRCFEGLDLAKDRFAVGAGTRRAVEVLPLGLQSGDAVELGPVRLARQRTGLGERSRVRTRPSRRTAHSFEPGSRFANRQRPTFPTPTATPRRFFRRAGAREGDRRGRSHFRGELVKQLGRAPWNDLILSVLLSLGSRSPRARRAPRLLQRSTSWVLSFCFLVLRRILLPYRPFLFFTMVPHKTRCAAALQPERLGQISPGQRPR